MLLNQFLGFGDLFRCETVVLDERHDGVDPELCLTICVLNVNMRPRLLARKEIKPKSSDPQDRRTHRASLTQPTEIETPYGEVVRHQLAGMGIAEAVSAPESPWQNPSVERLIDPTRVSR